MLHALTYDPGMSSTPAGSSPDRHGIGGFASSPSTAALLTALFDLLQDARSRGARANGTASVLVHLAKAGSGCGRDLAAALHLDQSTVSRHLASLEADDLVRRTTSPADRRTHVLELTEAGRAAALAEVRRRVALLESAVESWPDPDVADLARLLHRFVADLRSTEEGPRT